MFTWILLASRAPQIGQSVDWLGFDGAEVGGGRYFGHDRWVQESAPPVRSHLVAAWRPAADFQDTVVAPLPLELPTD